MRSDSHTVCNRDHEAWPNERSNANDHLLETLQSRAIVGVTSWSWRVVGGCGYTQPAIGRLAMVNRLMSQPRSSVYLPVLFNRAVADYLAQVLGHRVWRELGTHLQHGPIVDKTVEVLVGSEIIGEWARALIIAIITLEGLVSMRCLVHDFRQWLKKLKIRRQEILGDEDVKI